MTTTLTAKQAAFVQEYLVDLNATQAAIRAGYSPKTANRMGAENLTKPVIAAAVRAAQADRAQRNELTTQVCAGRVELLVDKEERVIHKISFALPPGFTFAEPTADGAPVVARDEAAELRAAITDLLEGIQQHFDALDPFVEAIRDWVFAMCKGETRFKMSIPYEETDTDAILCAALKDSETLAAEVVKLREALSGIYQALRDRHHGRMPDEVRTAYERAGAALEAEAGQ